MQWIVDHAPIWRWRVMVCLTCLLVAVAFISCAASGGLPRKGSKERKPVSTKSFFNPKIDLKNVRMAFCDNGRVRIQLKEEYGEQSISLLTAGVLGSNPDGSLPWELSPAAQDKVFGVISERRGDTYTLLFPNSLTSRRFALTGVTLLIKDGLYGFLGILGDEGACPASTGPTGRVYALAIKGAPHIRANSIPVRPLTEADRTAIAEKAFRATGLIEADAVDEVRPIYCRYPDICGAIALVRNRETGDTYLTALVKYSESWEVFPIQSTAGHVFLPGGSSDWESDGYNIVYENRAPTGCGYFMHNSEFFILPDIDGNGANEVIVVSDIISILFSVELSKDRRQYVLQQVQCARYDL